MAKYDPSKQYQWEEDDEFIMSGSQFGLILNAFRQYLAKSEAQETILISRAEAEMTNILKEGVECGMVVEMPVYHPEESQLKTAVDKGPVNSKGKPRTAKKKNNKD